MKTKLSILGVTVLGSLYPSFGAAGIAGTQNNDANALVNILLSTSGGATTSNATVTPGVCSGTVAGGNGVDGATNWQVDSGVMLSSGAVSGIAPPNNNDSLSVVLGTPGDAFLDSLVGGGTQDACILEFDFQCPAGSAGSKVAFRYNFASEEYNEFVGSPFNDVFGFQLNGTNIAVLPDLVTPVAINNVNNGLNAGLYNDNDPSDTAVPFAIQADGFVTTLTAQGNANLPVNHIKMAIADRGDRILDSWVAVAGGSFECIVQIKVDIKPGSNPNCVIPTDTGVISVAFYSSPQVDATLIDEATIDYLGAHPVRCAVEDAIMTNPDGSVSGDGIPDLVCKFKKSDMVGLPQPGDDCVVVHLSGTFLNGSKWEGTDHMCVPGDPACEAGTPQ